VLLVLITMEYTNTMPIPSPTYLILERMIPICTTVVTLHNQTTLYKVHEGVESVEDVESVERCRG